MNSSSDSTQSTDSANDHRYGDIDLSKYVVQILGRDVIAYDKIKVEDPELYARLINSELESDKALREETEQLLSDSGASTKITLSAEDIQNPQLHDTAPRKQSINKDGVQTTKIFFQPWILSVDTEGVHEVPVDWAGRILPGQTIHEGIAAELQEVYGYTGEFDFSNIAFMDYAKDKKGNTIERYAIHITMYPDGAHVRGQSDSIEKSNDEILMAIIEEFSDDPADIDDLENLERFRDFLSDDLSHADAKRDKDAAEAVKVRMRVLEARIRELDPSYTYSVDQPMTLNDWNPPQYASAEDFYIEFEYYFGSGRIDEAAEFYLRFHPDESIDDVRARMQHAAQTS
jgi:hypothetical protein